MSFIVACTGEWISTNSEYIRVLGGDIYHFTLVDKDQGLGGLYYNPKYGYGSHAQLTNELLVIHEE